MQVASVSKRRRRRERIQEARQASKFQVTYLYPNTLVIFYRLKVTRSNISFSFLLQIIKSTIQRGLIISMIFMVIIASVYYGYKGLFLLSDWMNEMEEQRLHRRTAVPRF